MLPLIRHLKHDHRMMKDFLKGVEEDIINAIMVAAAFDLKKYLKTILFYGKNLLKSLSSQINSIITYIQIRVVMGRLNNPILIVYI